MKKITENLYWIETEPGVNAYLIKKGKYFDLIDTGKFMKTKHLVLELEEYGFNMLNLEKIILTHCHCDHIGGVSYLVNLSGAKVYAHHADVPYILQKEVINGTYHNMMISEQAYMKKLNCVVEKVDVILNDFDIINTFGGLQVISVPGHTPGSIALYQPAKKVMFWGDVVRNNKSKGLVIGVPTKFNYNTEKTIQDAETLLSYSMNFALFGHGNPIIGDVEKTLKGVRFPQEIEQLNH